MSHLVVEISTYVQCLYRACTAHACTGPVQHMYSACTIHAQGLYSACTGPVHCLYSTSTGHVQGLYSALQEIIYRVSVACLYWSHTGKM